MAEKTTKSNYYVTRQAILNAVDTVPIPDATQVVGPYPKFNAAGAIQWMRRAPDGTEEPLYKIPEIESLPDATSRGQVLYATGAGFSAGDDGKARWSEGTDDKFPSLFVIADADKPPFWDLGTGIISGHISDYWDRSGTTYNAVFRDPSSVKFDANKNPFFTSANTPAFLLGLQRLGTEGDTLNGDPWATPRKYPIYVNEYASMFINLARSVATPVDSSQTNENYQTEIGPGDRLQLKAFNTGTVSGAYLVKKPGDATQRKITIDDTNATFIIHQDGNYAVTFGATIQLKPMPPAGYTTAHRDGTHNATTDPLPAGSGTKPSFSYAMSILVTYANGTTEEFRGNQRQINLANDDIAYFVGTEETISVSANIKATAYGTNTTKVTARVHWFSFNNMSNWKLQATVDRSGQARNSIQELPESSLII